MNVMKHPNDPAFEIKSPMDLSPGEASRPFPPTDAGPVWPHLDALIMASALQTERLAGIGGSDANTILSSDPDRIVRPGAKSAEKQSPRTCRHASRLCLAHGPRRSTGSGTSATAASR